MNVPSIKLTLTVLLMIWNVTVLTRATSLVHSPYSINTANPDDLYGSTVALKLETRAPPTSYRSAIRKGRNMWAMVNDPLLTTQAGWLVTDISKWGWTVKAEQNIETFKDNTSGLEEALALLKVTPERSVEIRMEHSVDVQVEGVEYPATHAEYCGVYNLANGVLIASDAHSPAYRKSTTSTLKKAPLPKLQKPSDLTFLTWQQLASVQKEQQSPLRYVFIRGITNRKSQEIIMDALQKDGYKHESPLPWPNFWLFTPNNHKGKVSEPFLAVIGTENFKGIAYLLAQHQQTLGKKSIKNIRIWGDGGKSPVLHGMVELE